MSKLSDLERRIEAARASLLQLDIELKRSHAKHRPIEYVVEPIVPIQKVSPVVISCIPPDPKPLPTDLIEMRQLRFYDPRPVPDTYTAMHGRVSRRLRSGFALMRGVA